MDETLPTKDQSEVTRHAKQKVLKLSGNMIVIQLDENGEAICDDPEQLIEGYTEGPQTFLSKQQGAWSRQVTRRRLRP